MQFLGNIIIRQSERESEKYAHTNRVRDMELVIIDMASHHDFGLTSIVNFVKLVMRYK